MVNLPIIMAQNDDKSVYLMIQYVQLQVFFKRGAFEGHFSSKSVILRLENMIISIRLSQSTFLKKFRTNF